MVRPHDIVDIGGNVGAPAPLGHRPPATRWGDETRLRDATADEAVRDSTAALSERRARLARFLPEHWHTKFSAMLEREARTLSAAFASVPVVAVEVPNSSNPGDAVSRLARALGLP